MSILDVHFAVPVKFKLGRIFFQVFFMDLEGKEHGTKQEDMESDEDDDL